MYAAKDVNFCFRVVNIHGGKTININLPFTYSNWIVLKRINAKFRPLYVLPRAGAKEEAGVHVVGKPSVVVISTSSSSSLLLPLFVASA